MKLLARQVLVPLVVLGGLLLWSTNAVATDTDHGHAHGAQGEHAGGDEHSHGGDEHSHGEEAAHGEAGHHAPTGAPPVNWSDLGYGEKDIDGGTLDKGDTPMAPPLLFALLNFGVFAGLLYWKAGPALSKYLANRHEAIKNALEEAAKLQEEAKEKLKEYSARIADADAEVNALIAQIRKDAEAERTKLVNDAERQAERMKQDAEARIESEFLAARRGLEREVVAKAVEVAERLLTEKSSAADHGILFKSYISDLKKNHADGGLS
jgi:F-type H+-transporting ATPase subunit b